MTWFLFITNAVHVLAWSGLSMFVLFPAIDNIERAWLRRSTLALLLLLLFTAAAVGAFYLHGIALRLYPPDYDGGASDVRVKLIKRGSGVR